MEIFSSKFGEYQLNGNSSDTIHRNIFFAKSRGNTSDGCDLKIAFTALKIGDAIFRANVIIARKLLFRAKLLFCTNNLFARKGFFSEILKFMEVDRSKALEIFPD